MKRHLFHCCLGPLFGAICCCLSTPILAAQAKTTVIVSPADASGTETLAAREVRRYVYQRTGQLFPIVRGNDRALNKPEAIVVARIDRALLSHLVGPEAIATINALPPQSYWLKSCPRTPDQNQLLLLVGADDAGVLYAAYRFAELMDVRFYLHGDVLPDEQIAWKFPALDERAAPLFSLRGIQPFHDFPEGPDWWNRDDYLAIIGQLPKLRMNFFGLHTYPEARPNAEPTVWIGLPGDVDAHGKVSFGYPSSYQNTLRGNWGYSPMNTSEYVFGTAHLFETDAFGPEVMSGFIPAPLTPEASKELFDRTAEMLHDAFTFARRVGVKTCVGTEAPLVMPKLVQERLRALGKNPTDIATIRELYEGIFRRISRAYPLDYYWFWTPEDWTWSGVKEEQIAATTNDLFAAIAAHNAVQPPFRLATCGWVLGPQQDRAMFDKVLPKEISVSCINRQVGYTPVDPDFAAVQGRGKWAIPWMEDDPALSSPQLWVGRMRRDAADALRYGCDGLMGIHWRTRVLGPNIGALAHAAWVQQPWLATYKPEPPPPKIPSQPGPVGGHLANFPNNVISGTDLPTLYQTVRYDVSGYHLPASNDACHVTLKFCEPHYDAVGKRVFDVTLQGQPVITNLDIFARVGKNRALDFSFAEVAVTNGWLDIGFVPRVEFPSIAAIEIHGSGSNTKINCGGPASGDYAADLSEPPEPKQVFADTKDFYEDWARHEFGSSAGIEAAAIFQKIDCRLPIPSFWIDGPGGVKPDTRPWAQVRTNYTFVDDFAALRPKVRGAGSQERFDYWLHTFLYLRSIAAMNCAWAEYDAAITRVKAEKDSEEQKRLGRQLALPARQKLLRVVNEVYDHLLGTVSTPGELGTVMNWNQHNLPIVLTKPGEELSKILGELLPADALPGLRYHGPTRIIVPTKRTCLQPGEPLNLKVIVLGEEPPRKAALCWRKLGGRKFAQIPLRHLARGVYRVQLVPEEKEDLEYYVQVETAQGQAICYPATAPTVNQIVVNGAGL